MQGDLYLTRRGFRRALRQGETVRIPAFERVDLQLSGGVFVPSMCRLQLCVPSSVATLPPPENAKAAGASGVLYLRDLISGWVFQHPEQEWSVAAMASALQMTRKAVRATLFMQGDALTQLCKTQRLMRALFDSLLCNWSVADLKARLGWPDTSDLEASFQEWFGVSLQTVSRLREDAF
nr:hypothetical protein [Cupriavidus gilardii]